MKNCRCKTLEMQRMRNDARMSRELKERELIGNNQSYKSIYEWCI